MQEWLPENGTVCPAGRRWTATFAAAATCAIGLAFALKRMRDTMTVKPRVPMRKAIIITFALVLAGGATVVSTNANAQASSQHTITGGGQGPAVQCRVCADKFQNDLRNCRQAGGTASDQNFCMSGAQQESTACYQSCTYR
jgi:hypothetical protein